MVVINMGVEMVYILEQRLKAQSSEFEGAVEYVRHPPASGAHYAVAPDKSHKVLADVVRTMYSAKCASIVLTRTE